MFVTQTTGDPETGQHPNLQDTRVGNNLENQLPSLHGLGNDTSEAKEKKDKAQKGKENPPRVTRKLKEEDKFKDFSKC